MSCRSQNRHVTLCAAVNPALIAVAPVFFNRSMNIMAGFVIALLYTRVLVIRRMSIITVVTLMAVIFGAMVGPFTILIFFIVVPVCFLPLDMM